MTKVTTATLGAVERERERERERAYSLIDEIIMHKDSYLSMRVFAMSKNHARDG